METENSPEVTSEEQTDSLVEETESAELTPSEIKKYKVKVDGEELEVDETELLRGYQTRRAADKRFQEAALTRRQAEQILGALKENPIHVLAHLGLNVDELAENYLYEKIQQEQLSPEERRLQEYEAQLKRYQEQEQRQKQEQQQAYQAQLVSEARSYYANKVQQALTQAGLPDSDHNIQRVAYYLQQALNHEVDISPEEIANLLKQEAEQELNQYLTRLSPEQLAHILPEELRKALRQDDVNKVKTLKRPNKNQPNPTNPQPKRKRNITPEEYLRSLNEES